MQFWKDNKISGEYEMPVAEVAAKFIKWFRAEDGSDDVVRDGMPLERLLRWWMTSKEGRGSSWEAESGAESFEALFELAYKGVFGAGR